MADIKKILQLEDNEPVAKTTAQVLEGKGIEVELAITCEQAMQALAGEGNYSGSKQYYALLLDMGLPDGSGSDIARQARKDGFKGRIVIYSGMDMQEAKKQTADLNVFYCNKPCPLDELFSALGLEDSD